MELKDQLAQLQAELKTHFDKATEQQKEFGTISASLKSQIEAIQVQVDAIDKKLVEHHTAALPEESLQDRLEKDNGLKEFMSKKSGNYVIELDAKQTAKIWERKTTITSAAVGSMTSGVLAIDRVPGIVAEARQQLTVRQLLTSRPTVLQLIDFVKVLQAPQIASPQTEASAKAENAVTFTTKSERVQTLATWIPASRQVLDDMTELMGFIMTMLPYYVDLDEEVELLSGSGVDPHLDGLITQASAFNTSLLSGVKGWTKIDIIGKVIQQITVAKELQPTFVTLHPNDYWDIRLTKDTQGRYIIPLDAPMQLFGLQWNSTTSIASGTFLIGSGSPIAAEIRDRMGMTVEIATQHEDWFKKNLVAIRAEKRAALCVFRPGSYVTGSFTTSP